MIGVRKWERITTRGSVGRVPKNEAWTAGMLSESDAWDKRMFTGKQGFECRNGPGNRCLGQKALYRKARIGEGCLPESKD